MACPCCKKCCFLCGCTVTVTVQVSENADPSIAGQTFTGEIVLDDCSGEQAFGAGFEEVGGVVVGQQWIGGGDFTDYCQATCPISIYVSGEVIAWSNYNLRCESCCGSLYDVGEFGNWNVPCEFPQAGQYFNQTPIGLRGQNCTLELLEFFETAPFVGTFDSITIDSIDCGECCAEPCPDYCGCEEPSPAAGLPPIPAFYSGGTPIGLPSYAFYDCAGETNSTGSCQGRQACQAWDFEFVCDGTTYQILIELSADLFCTATDPDHPTHPGCGTNCELQNVDLVVTGDTDAPCYDIDNIVFMQCAPCV